MTTVVSIWLALALALAAGLKAWRSDRAGAALATYGVSSGRAQRVLVWMLVSVELGLAGALAVGTDWASGAVAGLFLVFAGGTLAALLAGRGGRPCACFGSGSRLGWSSPARAAALALVAGVTACGWLPTAPSGYDRWLTLGLSLSIAALAALAVAVLSLAREVGVLRLSGGARGALEIAEEGPPVGTTQTWATAVRGGPPGGAAGGDLQLRGLSAVRAGQTGARARRRPTPCWASGSLTSTPTRGSGRRPRRRGAHTRSC